MHQVWSSFKYLLFQGLIQLRGHCCTSLHLNFMIGDVLFQDSIVGLKFLMMTTLLCAALTVIFFIISQVNQGLWKWGSDHITHGNTSAFLIGQSITFCQLCSASRQASFVNVFYISVYSSCVNFSWPDAFHAYFSLNIHSLKCITHLSVKKWTSAWWLCHLDFSLVL